MPDLVAEASISHPKILAVSRSSDHQFSKTCETSIELVAGFSVVGDAHYGATVQHRSRVAIDPARPNLRQVHLLSGELLQELQQQSMQVQPGQLGENILTAGIDLLDLPKDARLQIGASAVIEITGLRNPCRQIETFRAGLLDKVLSRDVNGDLVRRAGVMAIVLESGVIRPGDEIIVQLPPRPFVRLEPV